jgi:hypothetical protein
MKTTSEIRALLASASLDFEKVQNEALNAYLPKVFLSCPLSGDVCTTKQCIECSTFKSAPKR